MRNNIGFEAFIFIISIIGGIAFFFSIYWGFRTNDIVLPSSKYDINAIIDANPEIELIDSKDVLNLSNPYYETTLVYRKTNFGNEWFILYDIQDNYFSEYLIQ